MKQNCWEFMKCGRELDGENIETLGVCPACSSELAHGINGGFKGGRACWAISGTLCEGRVQGSYAEKFGSCLQCDFYKQVKKDEGMSFMMSGEILKRINPS